MEEEEGSFLHMKRSGERFGWRRRTEEEEGRGEKESREEGRENKRNASYLISFPVRSGALLLLGSLRRTSLASLSFRSDSLLLPVRSGAPMGFSPLHRSLRSPLASLLFLGRSAFSSQVSESRGGGFGAIGGGGIGATEKGRGSRKGRRSEQKRGAAGANGEKVGRWFVGANDGVGGSAGANGGGRRARVLRVI